MTEVAVDSGPEEGRRCGRWLLGGFRRWRVPYLRVGHGTGREVSLLTVGREGRDVRRVRG